MCMYVYIMLSAYRGVHYKKIRMQKKKKQVLTALIFATVNPTLFNTSILAEKKTYIWCNKDFQIMTLSTLKFV